MKHHISCIDLKLLFSLVNDLEKIKSFFFTPALRFYADLKNGKAMGYISKKPLLKRHRKHHSNRKRKIRQIFTRRRNSTVSTV